MHFTIYLSGLAVGVVVGAVSTAYLFASGIVSTEDGE